MYTQFASQTQATMRERLGEFLTRNMANAGLGWPIRTASRRREPRVRRTACSLTGLRVLIVGELTLELPVEVAATRRELLASLRGKSPGDDVGWTPSEPRVGGFVARAARAVAALGAQISVCATVPVPMPARFERFFDEHDIDRRYLTSLPSACPVTVLFQCQDSRIVERHLRNRSAAGPDLPRTAGVVFDTILVDPRHLEDRASFFRGASCCLDRATEHITVAVRLDRRLASDELDVAHDNRVWTFISHRHARSLTGEVGRRLAWDAGALARCLQGQYGIAKLVLQAGPRGAVLMNGVPCPYRVQTCPLAPANATGAGDTLMAVTALSSASGADDRTSIRRGVAAATGQVAGLPLPTTFEELDAA